MQAEPDNFQKAGAIDITAAALAKARKFGEAVAATQSGTWVVAFSWYKSQTITDAKKETTIHMGPGIDIGAFRVSEVPAAAVCETDGFRYVIQIPDFVVREAKKKLIDINPNPPPGVLLL